jgi:hypothetical protein
MFDNPFDSHLFLLRSVATRRRTCGQSFEKRLITVVAPYKRAKSRRNSALPLNILRVLTPSIPPESSKCGNHILPELENYVELLWDGLVERPGSREERKRKKKTRRWISTANAFQSKCFPYWV